jgi:hypothetical protein
MHVKRLFACLLLPTLLIVACSTGQPSGQGGPGGPGVQPPPGAPADPAGPAGASQPRVVRELTNLIPVPSFPRWAPGDARLLYESHDPSGTAFGIPTTLDVAAGTDPQPVGQMASFTQPALSPDGRQVALTGRRIEPDGSEATTIYLEGPGGEAPTDLLPGNQAKLGVSGTKFLLGWIDDRTLAFEEHMGSGLQALELVDTTTRKLLPLPEQLVATFFHLAPGARRVAGQVYGGPARFWVWDFDANQYLMPAAPLPGQFQWAEGWAGDDTLLFTAWTEYPFAEEAHTATLYGWNLKTGSITKLADDTVMAAATARYVASVRVMPRPTLAVAELGGKVLWEEDLGALPIGSAIWAFRPQVSERYVAYKHANGQWRLSPLAAKNPVAVPPGPPADTAVSLSPGGQYLTVLQHDIPAKLLILANPFEAR